MRPVSIQSEGWSAAPAVEARSFLDRLRGMKSVDSDTAVLLRITSIHTVGLKSPITVVAVGDTDRVERVAEVSPNRFARFAGAQYLIELPTGATEPQIGDRVSVSDV